MTEEDFKKMKGQLVPVAKKEGVSYLALFGSRARGDAKKNSDFDLLVRFKKPITLFQLVAVEEEFKKSLGNKNKVDLVTEASLSPKIRPYVMQDLKVIFHEE